MIFHGRRSRGGRGDERSGVADGGRERPGGGSERRGEVSLYAYIYINIYSLCRDRKTILHSGAVRGALNDERGPITPESCSPERL